MYIFTGPDFVHAEIPDISCQGINYNNVEYKMTSFKKIKSERKDKEINQIYFKAKQNFDEKFCNSALSTFNSIYKFHSSLQSNELFKPMKIKDCYTLTLANAIIEKLKSEKIIAGKGNSLPESFYDEIAETLLTENSDKELIIIFLKQMSNIMKRGGLILFNEKTATASESFQDRESLYLRLLESFWNETEWSEIFPSSPEAADKLHEKRNIFAELIQGFYTEVSVEDLANDFFEMTDIAERNDYFMISFLDFYLIAWLKNFGIIDYSSRNNTEIIYLSILDYGREILRKIV